jgi:prevent-host-death family protein
MAFGGAQMAPAEWTLAGSLGSGHIGHMRKKPLAHVKAHLSKIVDAAEHQGQRIVILRHGKPAAAVVPVEVAVPRKPRRVPASRVRAAEQSVRRFIREFSAVDRTSSAVKDLRSGRR